MKTNNVSRYVPQTECTKIKDFNVGDTFIFYGQIFTVTGELKTWSNHRYFGDTAIVYGRECKCNNAELKDRVLSTYDWMQGTEEVKYSKIIN